MLSGAFTSTPGTDYVYWYVTPLGLLPWAADAACVSLPQGSTKCQRARIRFEETNILTMPAANRLQGSCHELGHTLGFPHNSLTEGCMSGGTPNNGVLSQHEIDHINYCYGFLHLC